MAGANHDPLLNLAFALYSNPGVYALLLGSGTSRSAGVPTGWEVVLDLVRRLAAAGAEPEPADAEQWYQARFGERPEYSRVVARLARTPAERRGILRRYFEPSEEEREQGLKVPTPAHRAIARLCKDGCIRMILTTNFDRLMETALVDEGVAADVIGSVDALKGAIPYVHSRCVIAKLHGDYLDTRIRNTRRELGKYPAPLEQFLDRVMDEFGLIVCGWSGEWDAALVSALLRSPTRRFTTYWLARGNLAREARQIVAHRRADVIQIRDADQAFSALSEKVQALHELERPHPLSVDVAVATVKRYLAEDRFRIRLDDLLSDETESASASIPDLELYGASLTKELFQELMRKCEAATARLQAVAATMAYYDDGRNSDLLVRAIERLISRRKEQGLFVLIELSAYPALIVLYCAGLAALAGKRYRTLAEILQTPSFREVGSSQRKRGLEMLNVPSTFGHVTNGDWIPRPQPREYTPGSNHLHDLLRPVLLFCIPSEQDYEDIFDTLEYIHSLSYAHLLTTDESFSWAPVGRFGWRHRYDRGSAPWRQFFQEGLAQGDEWDVLRAGLFGASSARLRAIIGWHDTWLPQATASWH